MDTHTYITGLMAKMSEERHAKATQLTLGALIEKLKELPADMPIVTSTGHNPGSFMSYRGYYEDLSFDSGEEPVTVGAFLERAQEARGAVFEGYKGGDFPMHDKSLVWFSGYGSASGDAPMGVMQTDGRAVLVIERVDD